jgi:hypothetical protein
MTARRSRGREKRTPGADTRRVPALGSLREATNDEGFSLLCIDDWRPTPVLVAGTADLAEVDELAFHAVGAEGGEAFARARRHHAALSADATTSGIVERVLSLGYAWGVGNGT